MESGCRNQAFLHKEWMQNRGIFENHIRTGPVLPDLRLSSESVVGADVTLGKTGFNPYRISQLDYNDTWKKANMSVL